MNSFSPKNILIINLKFLGDLIVTTAAIGAIREKYPESKITVLVRKQYKDVLNGSKNINEIIYYDQSKKGEKGLARLINEIKFVGLLRKYKFDSVVSLQAGDRYVLWSFFSGAKIRVGPVENNFSFLLTHKADVYENTNSFWDYYLQLAKTFGADPQNRKTEFALNNIYLQPVEDFFSANDIDKRDIIICIHPGAGESSRKWKIENYPALIKKILEQTDLKIIFTLGPQEKEQEYIFESLADSRVVLHKSDKVQELAWIISKSSLVIGMDSGARHLAAALKIPSLSLFPEDLIKTWWFYKEEDKQFILIGKRNKSDKEHHFLDNISVEEVFKKTIQILKLK